MARRIVAGGWNGASSVLGVLGALLSLGGLGCSDGDDSTTPTGTLQAPLYAAGSTTFCVRDATRGFDPTAGMTDGERLIIVEAWYPVEATIASDGSAQRARFGDYFDNDLELLLRTERALLETTGFAPEVIEQHMGLAPAQFDVERGSYRNAPIAERNSLFPLVLYSHGTLQQRFTNDTMAENLAKQGYIVLAPEHTGNDALAPFGAFCESEMTLPGVMSAGLSNNPAFDVGRNEYRGQTFDPFFLVGEAAPPAGPGINPVEVSLTLDRVADYRATLAALDGALGEVGAAADSTRVGIVGYSRGAMHGLVGAELIDDVQASVALVGGTPLRFYANDAAAQPIHDALASATGGARTRLDALTKPVLDIIGGEDSRRKATTDAAAGIGVYDTPSAINPSPIVLDSFSTRGDAFGTLVSVADVDHFDLVDDPFVVAYRAQGGITRTGAFEPTKSYVLRLLAERQEIRDHYVLATLDVFLKGTPEGERFAGTPFAGRGVNVTRGE
jgi:dienelactone hydrolase